MPLRDILTVLAALSGAIQILAVGARRWRGPFIFITLLLLADQLWSAGPHWQALPAFAALTIDCIFFGRGFSKRSAAAAVLAVGQALASLSFMWVLPVFSLPAPTGHDVVGTRTLHLHDPQTGRELVVQLWYPAGDVQGLKRARYAHWKETKPQFYYWAGVRTNSFQDASVAAGAHPLLLFGHMWGGRRTQDTFLAEELASHGYIVAAIDHPGNAARVEMTDGTVIRSTMAGDLSNVNATTAQAITALWAKELAVWVRDDEAVLDQLLATSDLHIDANHIGAFGHSFGGASSMALLGKGPRVKCALNMDGWTFNGMETRTAQPVMILYAGPSDPRYAKPITTEPGTEGELDRSDQSSVESSLQRFGGSRATIAGTQHLDFTDQTLLSPLQRLTYTGPAKGERVRTIVRGLVVAFFDQNLEGTGSLPAYPEVKMESWNVAH